MLQRLAQWRRGRRRNFVAGAGNLVRDRRGATLVEFAFVAAPMIALMIATLETALVFFSQEALETGAEAMARVIMTGQAQGAGMTQTQFKNAACATLPTYLSCASLLVDVEKASSFSALNTAAPTITYDQNGNVTNPMAYSIGGSGDIVMVRLMYIWPVSTGPLGVDFGNAGQGKHLLISTMVSKTEPYA